MKTKAEQLKEWLDNDSLDNYKRQIVDKYEPLRPRNAQEIIDDLYALNNIDGIWSIHLDDVELPFEVEDWMYAYAMSLQPKGYVVEEIEQGKQTQADIIGYREVGEVFEYIEVKLKCTLGNGCSGCYFEVSDYCDDMQCSKYSRIDRRPVIFVKL